MQIRNVFFQNMIKHYDVVYVNESKNSINSQKGVDFTLYIKRRIFESHDNYIELFLLAMRYYDIFIFIDQSY